MLSLLWVQRTVLEYWSAASFESFFWVVRGRQLNSQPVSWHTLILFVTSLWCYREVSHLVVGEGRSKSWVFHTSLSHSDWLESRFRTWLSRRYWLVESRFHMWLLRSPWLIQVESRFCMWLTPFGRENWIITALAGTPYTVLGVGVQL